ncbi:hypothetical protein MPSEU_000062100 [Mayamaea pseudoterrestris]|nr:hypothetical protein MPSEU_000062100 [Mayamaea pseudoterrestris]
MALALHVHRSSSKSLNRSCIQAYARLHNSSSSGALSREKHILLEHIHKYENGTGSSIKTNPYISVLTLNRPKANAMGFQMLRELIEAIETLETTHSNSRCLVVTSNSTRVFSAGADLKERSSMSMDEAEAFVTKLRNTFEQLSRLSIPSIASMEGVAVGGGLELTLACDLRVASTQATLGLVETSLGILPGAGGTQRLPRLVGMARAKQMIYTAEKVNGMKAKEYGLVQYVVEPGQCFDFALELAWKIAANGPVAVRAAKQAMDDGMMALNMEEALVIERINYAKTLPTKDRLEGLAAFKEGRTPDYEGR